MKTLELQKNVQEELKWETALGSSKIKVTVQNAVVTLSGNVDDAEKKAAAENAAKRVKGIDKVINEITINQRKSEKQNKDDTTDRTSGKIEDVLSDTKKKKLKISGA